LDVLVVEDEVETLRLPLSQLLCQRRRDGQWRVVHPVQYDEEQADRHQASLDVWVSPDEPVEVGGRSEKCLGSHDETSWWLLYGDNTNGSATVTLSDGSTPPILTFGPLWLCEWVSPRQEALVTVGGQSRRMFDRIPGYLRGLAAAD
jgi:hypothetical protein